eukprot:TRINITY_DN1267_c0_g1_i1.p1 TRINITY_DN1267_c0_g1~~TRINITY_DN1267_c0_g1_i1.p1  ORF type:complete len:234 (-),score=13.83 TRINITY_DN1267_c0_g1_i1:295-969(-)
MDLATRVPAGSTLQGSTTTSWYKPTSTLENQPPSLLLLASVSNTEAWEPSKQSFAEILTHVSPGTSKFEPGKRSHSNPDSLLSPDAPFLFLHFLPQPWILVPLYFPHQPASLRYCHLPCAYSSCAYYVHHRATFLALEDGLLCQSGWNHAAAASTLQTLVFSGDTFSVSNSPMSAAPLPFMLHNSGVQGHTCHVASAWTPTFIQSAWLPRQIGLQKLLNNEPAP